MMPRAFSHEPSRVLAICALGLKAQLLLSRSLDLGMVAEVRALKRIDDHLTRLLRQHKASGAFHYIWRTRRDERVRSSHAENNGRIFSRDNPPPTGHPGEDFNCRCWAEPVDGEEYVSQILITPIHDNPRKWTEEELKNSYLYGNGDGVTLS